MKRLLLTVALAVWVAPLHGQPAARNGEAGAGLGEMVATERRFAARALVVGWKQAFLEYFADAAVGFDGNQTAPAKELFRKLPDPPKDRKLIWEPRYGDIAADGNLGYLTGPVQRIVPGQNNGKAFNSLYASVWKRQPDGSFKVVMDVGVPTPAPVTFAPGFTAAQRSDLYTGGKASIQSLLDTDAALTNACRAGQMDAYRGHLAEDARLYRENILPIVGRDAVVRWLATQPAYASGESRFAQVASSGDLGYSYGTYAMKGDGSHGYYVRVWTRSRDGVWRVALDVLQ